MSTPRLLTLILAAAALGATGAMAGSWPNLPAKKVAQRTAECCAVKVEKKADVAQKAAASPMTSSDGFEYIGGEPGWQLASPKYEIQDGHIVHAADCPLRLSVAPVGPAPAAPLEPSPGA